MSDKKKDKLDDPKTRPKDFQKYVNQRLGTESPRVSREGWNRVKKDWRNSSTSKRTVSPSIGLKRILKDK